MSDLLNTLLDDARLWRGHQRHATTPTPEQTGFEALDNQIDGLGWPRGALSECLLDAPGIGELQLVLPLLRRVTTRQQTVFWVNPPLTPYAPALAREGVDLDQLVVVQTDAHPDLLWTLENCLRSPATGLVMAWPDSLAARDIRRLQLAAEAGESNCILFQTRRQACQSSPAALRLELEPDNQLGLRINILKRRGGWPGQGCTLPLQTRSGCTAPESVATVIRGPWSDGPDPG
ncbi:translesion DNA synthesis-associated protein ImuA [Marinobacter lacisalsi]|uniref:Translesion DNA synthesis-associated protein ImuA n=1 Tax=Marinobacter lacisalsi TaxID=475979 RepID=A0ABV8QEK3_9GAMM